MNVWGREVETADEIIDWIEHIIAVQRSSERDEMGILPTESLGIIRAIVRESEAEVGSTPTTDALRRLMEWNGAVESAFIQNGRPRPVSGAGR